MNFILSKKWLPAAIIIVAGLLVFWRIDTRGINEWDEARNGVNAYEMYHNRDFINLYYAGAPDTWNAKPPLLIWLIAGSYRIFGFNAFALRLPAALCVLGFFLYALRFRRWRSQRPVVVLACIILLTCKAVLGIHTGLTADFDALLIFLLLASAWHFFSFMEEGSSNSIYAAALFTGLAFYAKGPAGLVYLPGFILYGCIRNGGFRWLMNYRIAIATGGAALFIASWPVLIAIYGIRTDSGHYASHNAVETMFVYDTWHRLSSAGFEGGQERDYMFVPEVLDVRFNLWNYLFYVAVAIGLYNFIRRRRDAIRALISPKHSILLFSICLVLPLAILLTFARYKYDWYLAPAFFFIAYIISAALWRIMGWWRPAGILIGLLTVITLLRQAGYVNSQRSDVGIQIKKQFPPFRHASEIVTIGTIRQDVYLYLKWTGLPITVIRPTQLAEHRGGVLVTELITLEPAISDSLRLAETVHGYSIGVIR